MDRFEQIESTRKPAGVPYISAAFHLTLKRGDRQIKIPAGRGVAGTHDPLDENEFTTDLLFPLTDEGNVPARGENNTIETNPKERTQ